MYLRTPKRYRPGRKRHLFGSLRWLWLWLLTPLIVFAGWQLYNARDELRAPLGTAIANAVNSVSGGLATAVAPTATPRPDPSQRLAVADSAWQTGAIEEAVSAYREVLGDIPNDVVVHYRVAFGLIMDGRLQQALDAAEATINANPYSADAWAIRSYALTQNDRPQEGIASALQALSLDPTNARALAFLASAYFDANQIQRARETVERALEADPEGPEAYYVRGLIYHYSDFLFEDAREDYLTALQYAPNMTNTSIELAWVNYGLQDYETAQATLLDVLELNPNNLDALFALSFVYYSALGDPQQALDPIQRCVELDPENRACLFYLGNVQRGLGDNTAALESYRRLIATGTQNPAHFLAAARAYLDSAGDCSSAVSLLEEGYRLEQEAITPNADRLATFTDLLQTCGSAGIAVSIATPTAAPEAAP
jgi:tetratricopeptide (TPR) repeat protein